MTGPYIVLNRQTEIAPKGCHVTAALAERELLFIVFPFVYNDTDGAGIADSFYRSPVRRVDIVKHDDWLYILSGLPQRDRTG